MNQKGFAAVVIILIVVIVLAVVGGVWYYETYKTPTIGFPQNGVTSGQTTDALQPESSTIIPTSATQSLISFYSPTLIAEATDTIVYGPDSSYGNSTTTGWGTVDFYDFGKINSGQLAGDNIVLEDYYSDCDEDACGTEVFLHYAKAGNTLFLLASSSDPNPIENWARYSQKTALQAMTGDQLHTDLLDKLGWTLSTGTVSEVFPEIVPAKSVTLARITMSYDKMLLPTSSTVMLATTTFSDPTMGTALTTVPQADINNLIGYNELGTTDKNLYGCIGGNGGCFADPLADDNFYFLEPDGTVAEYIYNPVAATTTFAYGEQLNVGSVTWDSSITVSSDTIYTDSAAVYQGGFLEQFAYGSRAIVPTSIVNTSDLEQVGTLNSDGSPVYDLINKNHPLYKAFYNYYINFMNGHPYGLSSASTTMSYDQFVQDNPLFLWRDPFGRLLLFKRLELLDPGGYCNDC